MKLTGRSVFIVGLLIGIVMGGCKLPSMFGGIETPAAQAVHPGGNGWTVQVHKEPHQDFAAVIHRSVSEFMVAPVQLDLDDGWWRVAAKHNFDARGLHGLSFHVRSADTKAVPVRFVVATTKDEWLVHGDVTVGEDGVLIDAAFNYEGRVYFYFFLLDDVIPFIVRDFTVTDVNVKVVSE